MAHSRPRASPIRRPAVRWALAGSVLAALAVLVGVRRWGGLAPPSLWLDDLWVGLAVREMGVGDLFHCLPPVPLGFVYLLKAVTGVLGMGEWQLQLLPFLCGLLVIPSFALLTLQLSGSLSLAVLAGALAAIDPGFAHYAIRVKQYSCDALTASVVLNAAVFTSRNLTLRAYACFVALAVLSAWVSFSSLLVTGPAFALLTAAIWRSQRRASTQDHRFWISAATFLVLMAAYVVLVVHHQRHGEIGRFWSAYFLPLGPIDATVSFLRSKGVAFLTGPFPRDLPVLAWLVPVGVLGLLARRETRAVGAFAGVFYLEALAAAALRLYPLGGPRLALYSHAVTITAAALGVSTLVPGRALPWLASASVLGLTGFALPALHEYPQVHDAQAVRHLNRAARPGDGIVVYPHAGYALAFYRRWPAKLLPDPHSSNGFYATADRPHVTLLPEFRKGVFFGEDPDIMGPELEAFLSKGYTRIHYLGAHLQPRPQRWILEAICRRGYVVTARYEMQDAAHYVFEKVGPGMPSAAGEPGACDEGSESP